MKLDGVHIVAQSSNSKTGPMPVSYRGKDTCPPSCPFLNNGCYGDGRIFALAHKFAQSLTIDRARQILVKRKANARYLRDRVVGDILTPTGKVDWEYLAAISSVGRDAGLTVFGYTHAWQLLRKRDVARLAKLGYVMNASCETASQVSKAISLGMPAVITNGEILEGAMIDDMRVITCPAQVRDNVTCATCGLCAKTDRKVVIRFMPHGPSRKRAERAIAAAQS